MLTRTAVVLMAFVTLGCASVKEHVKLATPAGETLRAGVGQAVFRIEKTRDLPNIYGRADIFGEQVPAGHQELRYLGLADERTAVFVFREVEIRSTETTMSRRGLGLTPLAGRREVSEPYEAKFTHNFVQQPEVAHSGVVIRIIKATPSELTYTLTSTGSRP